MTTPNTPTPRVRRLKPAAEAWTFHEAKKVMHEIQAELEALRIKLDAIRASRASPPRATGGDT